jgi:methyl-accepting chemotaxis protein/methyl-accepting chemotaxis protein-1 (serine sensor receptor)
MTLRKKLGGVFATTAVVSGTLIYVSISGAGAMGHHVQTLGESSLKLQMEGDLRSELSNLRTTQRGVIMYTAAHKPEKVEENRALFKSGVTKVNNLTAQLKPILVAPQAIEDLNAIVPALDKYSGAFDQILERCGQGDVDGALQVAADAGAAGNEMQARALDLVMQAKKVAAQAASDARASQTNMQIVAYVVAALMVALLIASGFITRGITSLLSLLAGEMTEGAAQVASAAGQVSATSDSIAQGASEQAASLEETSASMAQINDLARRNTENARNAANVMSEASARIDVAHTSLNEMVASMHEINASSDKISKIIRVIEEIAFQTNILALNAAVEAARAGQAGMGFAVVADEVRSLSQRCAQAAKDTSSLIQESIGKADNGRVKLDQVAAAINGITEASDKVRTLVDDVSAGAQEQGGGIEQIASAMSQMERVTQTAAASAEEGSAAGQELSAQSQTLQSLVERLKASV